MAQPVGAVTKSLQAVAEVFGIHQRVPEFHVTPLHAESAAHFALQSSKSSSPMQTFGYPSHLATQFAGPELLTGTPCPPPHRMFPPMPPTNAQPQSEDSGVHASAATWAVALWCDRAASIEPQ